MTDASLPIQLPTTASGKAEDDGPSSSVYATSVNKLTPGFGLAHSWLLLSFGGMNQQMDDLSVTLHSE